MDGRYRLSVISFFYVTSFIISIFVIISYYPLLNPALIAILYAIITITSFAFGYIISEDSFGRLLRSFLFPAVNILMFSLVLITRDFIYSLKYIGLIILVSLLFLSLYIIIIVTAKFIARSGIIHKNYTLDRELTKRCYNIGNIANTKTSIYSKEGGEACHSTYNANLNIVYIYFDKAYSDMLNDEELQSVILHEIGHHKTKDANITNLLYSIPVIFYLYLLGYLIVFVMPSISFYNYLAIGLLLFLIGSFFYFTRKLPSLFLKYELAADKYSTSLTNNPESMKNALLKLRDYYDFRSNYYLFSQKIKSLNMRVTKL